MIFQKATLVVVIILIIVVIVVILNLGIFSMAKNRGRYLRQFSRVYRRAREPWKEDSNKLQELSEQVAKYKDSFPQGKEEEG
jgi:hypothetical protein